MERTYIWTAADADEIQRFAALELQRYLLRLFSVSAEIVAAAPDSTGTRFLVGLVDAPHIRQASRSLPGLSAQGHLVHRTDPDTLVLAGGSGAAVAWAVYELVERYGVRYLLHEDIFPEKPGPFVLPDLDVVFEPLTEIRSWRQFNDLPTGPAMWGLAQQRTFIQQVFKLKFNSIHFSLWPQHPFIDYEVQGIRRRSAALLFGQKIPIDEDNIGREHLPDSPFLNNPDMLGAETFPEMLDAGRALLGGMLDKAQSLGMHTAIALQPMEFPLEFAPLLQQRAEGPTQLGRLTCAETGDLTNPSHVALVEANFEAYLQQWGRVDELRLHLPEQPKAESTYRESWQSLDSKYGLERDFPLAGILSQAERDYIAAGGPERALREIKSTVSMVRFFDDFFAGNDLLKRAGEQNISVKLDISGTSAPLLPVIERAMWDGGGVSMTLAYTSSRAVRKMHLMEGIDATRVPTDLIMTLQDDNIGLLPQVATESMHLLLRNMQRLGWRGLFTRCWPIGDLDPPVAYLARACWDPDVTPRKAYEDHFSHLHGPDASESLGRAMRILEDATIILDLDFLSLFFPVLGIMCRPLEAEEPMPVGLYHVRAMYEQCRRILAGQQARPGLAAGESHLDYMVSRLDFAIHALNEKERLSDGSVHVGEARAAREAGDRDSSAEHLAQARDLFDRAIESGAAALRASASQVRDDSDKACLAAYYHFFVREVRERTSAVLADLG